MAGWIKQSKQSVPQEQPSHESPVAVLDEPKTILDEHEARSLFRRQIEARRLKAQEKIDRRAAEEAERQAVVQAEFEELWAAAEELRKIEELEQAEKAKAEQERKERALEDWRSATVAPLLTEAVAHHERTQGVSLLEQARIRFEEMFRVPAPPAELWKQDGPHFEVQAFEQATVQMVVHPVAAEIGEAEWIVTLFGPTMPNGNGSFQIADRGVLGRQLVEYPGLAEWLGMPEGEMPQSVKRQSDEAFLAQFGLPLEPSPDEAVLLDAPAGI